MKHPHFVVAWPRITRLHSRPSKSGGTYANSQPRSKHPAVFVIAVGAILTGLYTLVGTHGEESLFGTYAVGGLVGGSVGALWSLLMSRLPPNAGAGRILLRGIVLGAVAGPVAMLLVPAIWLIGHNTRIEGDPLTYAMGMIVLSELFAIPAGVGAGLVCSLLVWYIAARKRRKAPAPCTAQGEDAPATNSPRLPRSAKARVILLGILSGAAPSTYLVLAFVSTFKLEHPNAVIIPIWTIAAGVTAILPFLPPGILGGGAFVGLFGGLAWAVVLRNARNREEHRQAKQGIQTFPLASQTEAPLQPPAPAPPEKSGI